MPTEQATTMSKDDPAKQYTCCKGFLVYGGLQRSVGDEPHCLGFKKSLENVEVTEEDADSPPPQNSRFIFVGVGCSVYNEDMLSRHRLPLVNGFSQLIVSKNPADELQKEINKGRRRQQQQQQQQQEEEEAQEARLGGGRVPAAAAAAHGTRVGGDNNEESALHRRETAVSGPLTTPEDAPGRSKEERGGEARATIEKLLAAGRERVERQARVSVELARAVPSKARQAAGAQVAKAREMPGMMMETARSGVDLGASAVRFIGSKLAEEEEDGQGKKK